MTHVLLHSYRFFGLVFNRPWLRRLQSASRHRLGRFGVIS
jgi:hypothetical protein